MSSLASRRINSQGDLPDLNKLEISNVSDVEHEQHDTPSDDDDYCDNVNQFGQLNELTLRQGAETAPVISDNESSLKRYIIEIG